MSVIERIANLECQSGHLWYSPTPGHWNGRECGMPAPLSNKKTCQKKLAVKP